MVTYPSNGQITWNGITYNVRDWSGGPGPNEWNGDGVFIDDENQMHLTIKKISNVWYSTEVDTVNTYLYGLYRWKVETPMNDLDPNIVLGLFTYLDDTHEIDIEFSNWEDDPNELWYSNQPTTFPGYNLTSSQAIICQFDWQSDHITWSSWYEDGTLIAEYTSYSSIPSVYSFLMFNLWLIDADSGMDDGQDYEVVLSNFEINPTSPPIVVYKTFECSSDVRVSKTMVCGSDINISKYFTSSSDILIELNLSYNIKLYQCTTWTEGDTHGGAINTGQEIVSSGDQVIFDNVSNDERVSGDVEYRKIYLRNENASTVDMKLWIESNYSAGNQSISIALGTNDGTQSGEATGLEYLQPTSPNDAINIGELTQNSSQPVWIRRTISTGGSGYTNDSFTLGIGVTHG